MRFLLSKERKTEKGYTFLNVSVDGKKGTFWGTEEEFRTAIILTAEKVKTGKYKGSYNFTAYSCAVERDCEGL